MIEHPNNLAMDELRQRLGLLERRVRAIAILRGAGQTVVVGVLCAIAAILIDLAFEPSREFRTVLLGGSLLAVLITAWRTLVRTLSTRLSMAELAAVVEREYPQLGEQLLSAVEMQHEGTPERFRGSAYMREQILADMLASIRDLDFRTAVSSQRGKRWGLAGAAALLALLFPFMAVPKHYSLLWARYLKPWERLDPVIGYSFQITQAAPFAARGRDVPIRVRIERRRRVIDADDSIAIRIIDDTNGESRREMLFDSGTGEFAVLLPHVERTFDFQVLAGRSVSDVHHVEVVDTPSIKSLALDIAPPSYTQLPATTLKTIPAPLRIVEGTRLTFRATFNKPMEHVELRRSEAGGAKSLFTLSNDKQSGEVSFIATRNGRIHASLQDIHGLKHDDENRDLVTIPDQPPTLFVSMGDEYGPIAVRPEETLRVPVEASDDFGIASLALVAELPGGSTETIEAKPVPAGTREVSTAIEWNLTPHQLAEGTLVKFRVRARDNRPEPGPNESWSPVQMVLIDRTASPADGDPVARRQDKLKQRLAAVRAAVEDKREQISRLDPPDRAAPKEDLARFAETWSQLVEEQSELANRLRDLALELMERPLFVQLADEAREISEQQIRAAGRRMGNATEAPRGEQTRATNEAVELLTAARDRLIELEKRFDELAAAERDLLRLPQLARRTESLAQETRMLAERTTGQQPSTEESTTPTSDQALEPLKAEQAQLSRDVQSLFEKHTALLDAARRIQIDRLAEYGQLLETLAEREQLLAQAIEEDATPPNENELKTENPQPTTDKPADEASRLQIALQMQVRLAAEAASAILERSGGGASIATSTVQLARQVDSAARQAWGGRLAQSAEIAAQAASEADNLVTQLRADEDVEAFAPAIRELEVLAERLRQIEVSAAQLATSPAARQNARRSGQMMLRQQTEEIAKGLQQITESLSEEPLRLDAVGESARQAMLAARAAGDLMRSTTQSIELGERLAGMNSANKSVAELSEAARWARDGAAAGAGIGASSPENIAGPLAEAAHHLQQAGRDLAQQQQATASGGDRNQNDDAREAAEAEGRDDAISRSAKALDRSAKALTQAANNAKRGGMPQPGSDSGSNSAGSSESTTLSGSAGTGAWGLREIEHLEAELERHARRDWGGVPLPAQTHFHEPGRGVPRGEYSKMIERYFRELANDEQREDK